MLPMLVPMLTNVIGGLVADAATNLAKDHVMRMVDKCIPQEAKGVIDELVNADPSNPAETIEGLIDCMCDPANTDVPAMPVMPNMDDVNTVASQMWDSALQSDTVQWANTWVDTAYSTAVETACTVMETAEAAQQEIAEHADEVVATVVEAVAQIEPITITYNVTFDPEAMDINIERA